jgi:hypothetical protein
MSEIRTGVYRCPTKPDVVVVQQIEEFVLYRDYQTQKTGLVGPLLAYLERNGYRWEPRGNHWN